MNRTNTASGLRVALDRKKVARASLIALVILVAAATAGGDSLATCAPKDEKLYTPNESVIKAEIAKLGTFESDMRAVLTDIKALQTENEENRFWGKVTVWRTIAGETGKAICSGVSLANDKLAVPCKTAQETADMINDIKACGEGETTGCVGAGLGFMKKIHKKQGKKLDRKVEELGGKEAGANLDPRYLGNEDLQNAKGKANINELKRLGADAVEKGNTVAKGGVDALTEACKSGAVARLGIMPGLPNNAGKPSYITKGCDITGSMANITEAYKAGQELDNASNENQERQAKLIQRLEAKVSSISLKIAQLKREVDVVVDWSAMGKPEPNMTPIKQEGCDDTTPPVAPTGLLAKPKSSGATEEEVQRALSQMSKPGLIGSIRSPEAEANSSSFNAETVGALLGGAVQALSAISSKPQPPTTNSPLLQGNTYRPRNLCRERGKPEACGFEGNKAAPDPR